MKLFHRNFEKTDVTFLPERMKIERVEKLAANLHNKKKYVIHTKSLKQTLNHELVSQKVHAVIKFNQKAWLELYIDMNVELSKNATFDFKKDFSRLMTNVVFGKM